MATSEQKLNPRYNPAGFDTSVADLRVVRLLRGTIFYLGWPSMLERFLAGDDPRVREQPIAEGALPIEPYAFIMRALPVDPSQYERYSEALGYKLGGIIKVDLINSTEEGKPVRALEPGDDRFISNALLLAHHLGHWQLSEPLEELSCIGIEGSYMGIEHADALRGALYRNRYMKEQAHALMNNVGLTVAGDPAGIHL